MSTSTPLKSIACKCLPEICWCTPAPGQQSNHSAAKVDWKMMFDTPSTLPGMSNPAPSFLVSSGFCRFLRRGTPMTMMACYSQCISLWRLHTLRRVGSTGGFWQFLSPEPLHNPDKASRNVVRASMAWNPLVMSRSRQKVAVKSARLESALDSPSSQYPSPIQSARPVQPAR